MVKERLTQEMDQNVSFAQEVREPKTSIQDVDQMDHVPQMRLSPQKDFVDNVHSIKSQIEMVQCASTCLEHLL